MSVLVACMAVRQTLGMRGNPSFGRRVRVTTTARRRGGTTTTRLLRVMFFDVRRFSFFTSVSTFLRFRLRERQIFCQCDDVAENPGRRHRGAGSDVGPRVRPNAFARRCIVVFPTRVRVFSAIATRRRGFGDPFTRDAIF